MRNSHSNFKFTYINLIFDLYNENAKEDSENSTKEEGEAKKH